MKKVILIFGLLFGLGAQSCASKADQPVTVDGIEKKEEDFASEVKKTIHG